MRNIRLYSLVAAGLVVVAVCGVLLWKPEAQAPAQKKSSTQSDQPAGQTFNKSQHSTTDPASIWVVVNKQHALNPKEYVPSDLVLPKVSLRVPGNESMQVRTATASALEAMFSGAKQQGTPLMLASGYRSYNYQVSLYGGYVKTQGQAEADKQSARPGYSEHQTGLAADVEPLDRTCEVENCFKDTPAGKWVAANAYKYGFIIRYASDKETVTGYEYEPWHVRYIGIPLATELHKQGIETLEEFFGISGGTTY